MTISPLKARLSPVFFRETPDGDCVRQIENLRSLLHDVAEILDPVPLGSKDPNADAVYSHRFWETRIGAQMTSDR
jgi:hypothetical protein